MSFTWIQRSAPLVGWEDVASSADGTKLVAVNGNGEGNTAGVYTSSNSGVNWNLINSPYDQQSVGLTGVASCADGNKIAICDSNNSPVYTSSDTGATWYAKPINIDNLTLYKIRGSADGNTLIVGTSDVLYSVGIFTSPNTGTTWNNATTPGYGSVAISEDGLILIVVNDQGIYTSSDVGLTFVKTSAPVENYTSVASCMRGRKLVAVTSSEDSNGSIYTSSNYGLTWIKTSAPPASWISVASSADGTRLVALGSEGKGLYIIYTSSDSGLTWIKNSAPSANWKSVASSVDGLKLVAVSFDQGIYTGTFTPATISNICFPAGTPVKTDQGIISIEQIDTQKHTIHNQPILHVTQTVTLDKYLICFEKGSIGPNLPNKKTVMSKDHQIMYNGQLVPAYRFLDMTSEVKKVKYSGEILYNVLLADWSTMSVNNLICETLDPKSAIAQHTFGKSVAKTHF